MYRYFGLLIFLIFLLAVPISSVKADIGDGLLVWHDFDDLVDDSGNGHDAVLSPTAYIADGLLHLEGDGGYADIGPETFGPVNPMVDGLSDFTVAIAYASTQTDPGAMLLSVGPIATGEGTGDFSLITDGDLQFVDHWWVGAYESDLSGVGYADGTVHLVIVTYQEGTDTYTFYHIDAGGAAVSHGDAGDAEWAEAWDESLDYTPRIGTSANLSADEDFGPSGGGDWAYLDGQVDTVAIWNRALDTSEMPEIVEHVPGDPEDAANPSPKDGATDVPRDVVLSWTAGVYANQHDVYFGTSFDDVSEATTTVDPNNVYKGRQNPNHYPISGTLDLEFGTTYYWRIDEVNAPPHLSIYTGNVWSFTVEPFAYAIDSENITVTASSNEEDKGPENTINGSGLDDDDLHSKVGTDMWLTAKDAPQPAWIQYEFDRPYKLHEIWIWNHNTAFESYLGFGLRDVTIEYSTNGTDWTQLDDVPEFARAPGEAGYAHDPTIDMAGGTMAKYVKMTANSNWGGLPQYGLSEVRFLYVPVWARQPDPQDEAEDVDLDVVLSWRPGREAASHDVCFGTDWQALADGSAYVGTVSEASYDAGALQALELGETYYWKINEVNEAETPATWEGDIWSFLTPEYLIVDDFEDYTDDLGSRIFQTWIDGLGYTEPSPGHPGNGTGSAVGNTAPPFAEQDIVHEDRQSMPFAYTNDGSTGKALYSEAQREWAAPQNWMQNGVKALTLWFYGDAANSAERLYVGVQDSLGTRKDVPHPNPTAVQVGSWQEFNIDLQEFANAGVNLTNIKRMYVGVGNRLSPQMGGTGRLYFDDIRLYPPRCILEYKPAGDITGDCFVDCEDFSALANSWHITYQMLVEYTFNTDLSDTSGNNRHGIDHNKPIVNNGILTLDGTNFVDIPLGADNPFDGSGDFSIAMDFQSKVPSVLISSARDAEPDNHSMSVFVHHWDEPSGWSEVIYDNFWIGASAAEDDPLDGEWHTIVVTYDADGAWDGDLDEPTGWVTVYLDGIPGEGMDMNPAIPNIAADTVRIGSSLNTEYPYEEGVGNFSGNIDNVRIYNFALTHENVLNMLGVLTGLADLNGDKSVGFGDLAILVDTWLEEILWP